MGLARQALLAASTSRWLRQRAVKTAFVRRSVSAFMPGERLEDAIAAARTELTSGVAGTILTRLGENLTSDGDANGVTRHYLDALERVSAAGLRTTISVKPTQLGLDFDQALCLESLYRLQERADVLGNFVWIDMEGSPYVDRTLDLFRKLRARSPRVGVALQAYLYRTVADLESLLPLGPAVRIVKGAYLEPASIAFSKKRDVDESFFKLATTMLTARQAPGTLLHVATHDAALVDRVEAFVSRQATSAVYEYAMLYGIQRPLQRRLAAAGRPVNVLIAYGDYWFPWYMRRLAERPANVGFVLKNLFAR